MIIYSSGQSKGCSARRVRGPGPVEDESSMRGRKPALADGGKGQHSAKEQASGTVLKYAILIIICYCK
jgi:hypothetical protein